MDSEELLSKEALGVFLVLLHDWLNTRAMLQRKYVFPPRLCLYYVWEPSFGNQRPSLL